MVAVLFSLAVRAAPRRIIEQMSTTELAIELREVVNHFAVAAQALLDGELGKYRIEYVKALRALDAYQDVASSAIG